VTCVAVGGQAKQTIFAGSWDKNVWSWSIGTGSAGRKYLGHTDFVKAVLCTQLSGKDILISGGADKKILIWDIATGQRLHTLTDTVQNMLAVQDLVLDPVHSTADEAIMFSASSDPHIRRWRIRLDSWEQLVDDLPGQTDKKDQRTILVHETGVYRLVFDHDGEEVDLWTSSADGTAKCLSRIKGFKDDDIFEHGDHVRAVAVTDTWVITAGRDEDLKFWDRSSGKLYAAVEGHFDEVTDLLILKVPSGAQGRDKLCSVSIDGTVRTWPLDRGAIDALVAEQAAVANGLDHEEREKTEESGMTADEEAELAALMDDD